MTNRKKILLGLMALFLVTLGLTISFYLPYRALKVDVSQVAEVTIAFSKEDKKASLTEKTAREEVCEALNGMVLLRGLPASPEGEYYTTEYLDAKGKVLKQLVVLNEKEVIYRGFTYTVQGDTIDLTRLSKLDSENRDT